MIAVRLVENENSQMDAPEIPELTGVIGQLGDIMLTLARLHTGDEDLDYLEVALEQLCERLS